MSTDVNTDQTGSAEFTLSCVVLGLDGEPTLEKARQAYKQRAALLHPDVHQHTRADLIEAATAAMAQLNEAYTTVTQVLGAASAREAAHASHGDQGHRWRCPRCSQEFRNPSRERATCPRCGIDLRGRSPATNPRPGPTQGSGGEDREFVYATSRWSASDRRVLSLLLSAHCVAHDWERGDLIVSGELEALTDRVLADAEELLRHRRRQRSESTVEVCFSVASWTTERRATIEQALAELNVDCYVEGHELVVDKVDERLVDDVIAAMPA